MEEGRAKKNTMVDRQGRSGDMEGQGTGVTASMSNDRSLYGLWGRASRLILSQAIQTKTDSIRVGLQGSGVITVSSCEGWVIHGFWALDRWSGAWMGGSSSCLHLWWAS